MFVPTVLHDIVGKKELRYSLRTGSIGTARLKARFIAGSFQLVFKQLIKDSAKLKKLTAEHIQGLVQRFIKDRATYISSSAYTEDFKKGIPYYQSKGLDLPEIH